MVSAMKQNQVAQDLDRCENIGQESLYVDL